MSWLAYLLLLFALSWAGVGIYRWYAIDKGLIDNPNARSSHIAPTPRGGGVIFFFGWLVLLSVLHYYRMVGIEYIWYFLPCIFVGLIGFWDDFKNLSASLRLIVHVFSAALALYFMNENGGLIASWFPFLPWPGCLLVLVLGMVWMTNLFNFMDGSDGIAASEAMVVFTIGGYFLYDAHAYELATLAWGLVALVGGFLTWNWPLAQIFMGDSGSGFLGFMVALFALISYKFFQIPLLLWAILTGVFWFDATLTLVRRMLAGEEWRKPHRSHAYQRLIQAGWTHQQVLLGTITINAVLAGLAVVAYRDQRLLSFAFGVSVAFLSCIYIVVELIKPMFKRWHEA